MTLNFPGPYQVDINYIVDTLDHKITLNCSTVEPQSPGADFADIEVNTRAIGPRNLQFAIDALVEILQPFYNADCSFTTAALYKVADMSFVRTWISEYTIGEDGTDVGDYVKASEQIMTFRSGEGGIMKFTLEETIYGQYGRVSGGAVTGDAADLRDYINADSTWVLARDTSYPIATLNWNLGQNETVFRKRYR